MSRPEQIFPETVFDAGFAAEQIRYDEGLHFWVVGREDNVAVHGMWQVLGFGAPPAREGGFDAAPVVTPLTGFDQLHPDDRTIDKQGKGVGPRMYNTPQAAQGLTDLPDAFGAYTFTINPDRIHDARKTEGGTLTRIGRHGMRMAKARLSGVEKVVSDIHEQYGDAPAVHFTQPPRAEIRQTVERRAKAPEGVPPEFMLIRDATIMLHRVGTYRIDRR